MNSDPDILAQINRALESAPGPATKWKYDPGPIIGTRRMDTVGPEPITWLWPGRIAQGKVTLIAGDPGLGKSMIICAIAAHVSRGTPWPADRGECPQGDVLMVSAEDDPGDTIRARLDAAGADVSKVEVLTMVSELDRDDNIRERSFNLAKDMPGLDHLLQQTPECRLVTIDPYPLILAERTATTMRISAHCWRRSRLSPVGTRSP